MGIGVISNKKKKRNFYFIMLSRIPLFTFLMQNV